MTGFYPPNFKPHSPGEDRDETPGEAAVRLASWWMELWGLFGVRFYKFEEDGLQKAAGAYVRRWPWLAKGKARRK